MTFKRLAALAIAGALSLGSALAQSNPGTSPLSVTKGGTGGATAAAARSSLGLGIGSAVQAWDADLDALAAFVSTGFAARTASNTWAQRTLQPPAAGITITNPAGVAGDPTLVLANDLAALEAMSGTGLVARTASETYAQRTITQPAAGITVTNGDGVSGNPTLALANDLAALEALSSTGYAVRTTTDTWAQRTFQSGFGMAVTNGDGVSGNTSYAITDAELVALAGLTSAADKVPYFTGSGAAALADFTSYGRSLVAAVDAAAARTVLGLGTAAIQNTGTSGGNLGLLNANITRSGTETNTALVDLQERIRASSFVTSTQIVANADNYTATDGGNTCATKRVLRISSDAARDITGLSCSQADGDLFWIYNAGAFTITLKDETTSTAANRFGFGADLALAAKQGAFVIYDGVASRYRQVGGPSAAGGSGFTSAGAGLTSAGATVSMVFDPGSITNCTLVGTVAANALTVALKNQAGSDPSAGSPCVVSFRNATVATGDYTAVLVTAATSFVTGTSGATFGTSSSSVPFRLWITAWNNAGTVVLGVSNQSTATAIFPLNEGNFQSAVACNACTNANLAGTFYTTATQANKAIRILGYMDWASGLATAGTWASGPTTIQMFGPGVKKPGDVVQVAYGSGSGATTGSGTTPTVAAPSATLTPTSAPNLVEAVAHGGYLQAAAGGYSIAQMYRAAGASGACTTAIGNKVVNGNSNGGQIAPTSLQGLDAPGSAAQQTWVVCISNTTANNPVWCSNAQATQTCNIMVKEIMGAAPQVYDNDNDPRLVNAAA